MLVFQQAKSFLRLAHSAAGIEMQVYKMLRISVYSSRVKLKFAYSLSCQRTYIDEDSTKHQI